MQFQLAYLQIHSHYSPFGGISDIEDLAETLENLSSEVSQPVAAALTDTFSLAGFPLWQRLLAGTNITPLAGAEVGVSFVDRSLPFSLLLLAESQAGYANLCRLLSAGLGRAGAAPLTARVDLDQLAAHSKGLIAIAPYTGGAVTAALLSQKNQEAKIRATTLRDLFGPGSFYVGAPPLAAQLQPQTIDRGGDRLRGLDPVKVNAALVKLCRDLKIGLIGTGETRFARPEEAPQFLAARSRLQKALTGQFTPQQLQQHQANQDWLYSPRPGWPVADLYLRPVAELLAHYNEADWPGALTGNLLVAGRCASWQFTDSLAISQLREVCETALTQLAGTDNNKLTSLRLKLEAELTEIDRLNLAENLLAARQLFAEADPGQLILARRLNTSLAATLLGLTGSSLPPEELENAYPFEAYTNGRPLRLEVGPNGREKLLEKLNRKELKTAPLALPTDPGEVPTLHPRLILYSPASPLADLAVLQPASTRQGLAEGAQSGPVAPPGTSRFELSESAGLGHLQLAVTILNHWQTASGKPLLAVKDLPAPALSDKTPDSLERQRILKQLEWCRLEHPAAYFAAALTLAPDDNGRLNGLAQAIRLSNLALLAPDIQASQVEAALEGAGNPAIRSGLGRLVNPATARQIVEARPTAGFSGLDDLIKKVPLTAEQVKKLAWSGALDVFGKREQLAEAAARLEQAGQNWQEWQQQQTAAAETVQPAAGQEQPTDFFGGQLSLFDFTSSFEPAAVSPTYQEPEPVKLEEVPALSGLEYLRRSYEVLGYFNAEHPLWNQPTFLNADANQGLPLTIAEALEQAGQEQPVLISGLVTALRRIPVKVGSAGEPGEELTILNLEDFSGRVQLLVSHKVPVGELELKEGVALAARAQRLPEQAQVLAAVALAPFPPQPGDPVAFPPDEVMELETGNALEAYQDEQASPGAVSNPGPPQQDNGWANSLFASVGVEEPVKVAPAPAANNNRGRNGGGKAAVQPSRPLPRTRRVHIHLPKDVELDIMDRLKQVLRQHAGDDALIIHLPLPDGSIRKLEPQSLQVTYSPALVNDINGLIGAGGIELEER